MTVAAGESGRDLRVIGLVGAGHFLSHFYIFALPPLFPILKDDLDVGYIALGAIVTSFNTASGITQLPVGFLVDRLGARTILLIGLVLEAAAFIAIGVAGTYWGLVAFMAVAGIANSVYHPADYSILSASVQPDRMGRAFSLHTFAGYAGGAAAPVIMVALASFWDWRTAVIMAGVLGLAIAAVMAAGGSVLVDRRPMAEGAAPVRSAGAALWDSLGMLLSPPILLCFLFFMLLAMSSGGINNFAVAAFVDIFAHPLGVATTALSAFLVGSAVGILAGGVVADRTHHHERVAMAGFGATALIVLFVGNVDLPGLVLIAVLGFGGFLFGMIMPSRDMLVRRATPEGSMGTVFAFVSVGLNIGGILTPILFGWVMQEGEPRWLFWLAALFMLFALGSAFATRLTRQR